MPNGSRRDYRRAQLKEAQINNTIILDHEKAEAGLNRKDKCKGTVGAVALDQYGNLAATSTGGLCNKDPGRIGDSALIGAGTYAKNSTCAVSATGHGELFIRSNIAGRLSMMMEFGGMDLDTASQQLIFKELPEDVGGLIAVDSRGNVALPFNTGGMFRGWMSEDGQAIVEVWKDEQEDIKPNRTTDTVERIMSQENFNKAIEQLRTLSIDERKQAFATLKRERLAANETSRKESTELPNSHFSQAHLLRKYQTSKFSL